MKRLILPVMMLIVVVALSGCPRPQTAQAPPPMPPPALASPPGAAAALTGEVIAYIPCGMIIPTRAVTDEFQKQNPGVKVVGKYDNAPIIVKRLTEKKEPADIVVTPGKIEMAMLEEKGLVTAAGEKTLGTFELVCLVPATGKLKIEKPADLKQCKTIAMPSPDVNSTGASGRDALTKLGLWESLKPKMLLPTHAVDALTMVAAGKAQAAIAYRNCPLETNPEKLSKSKVRIAFSFPADSYERQPLLATVTNNAPNRAAAEALLAFMDSAAGRKLLADNGMTGCMDAAACPAPAAAAKPGAAAKPSAKADIAVVAYYPGNEGHAHIRKLMEGLSVKYGPRVSGRFVAFDTDEGFKEWHDEKGMACGGLLINDEQTWTYEQKGQVKEVSFKMAMGGEWTPEDLDGVIKKLLAEKAK